MPTIVHRMLKTKLTEKGLSIQEVFEEFAIKTVESNAEFELIVNGIVKRKELGVKARTLLEFETEEFYELMENDDK